MAWELIPEWAGDAGYSAQLQPHGEASDWPERDLPFGFTPAPSPSPVDWWADCGVVD